MTSSRRTYKITSLLVGILTLLILADFSPMLYQRLLGDGGTFVKYYNFNVTGDSLIKQLETIGNNMELKVIPDKNNSGYSQV